jgi:hypothetical protein
VRTPANGVFAQGGFLRADEAEGWPAAIHPQTPAVPETKWPRGFGHHSGTPGPSRFITLAARLERQVRPALVIVGAGACCGG